MSKSWSNYENKYEYFYSCEIMGILKQQDREIVGHTFPLTLDRLYAAEYARAGKRYPRPKRRKSKMRMSKKWRKHE